MRIKLLLISALVLCSCSQDYEKLLTDNSTKMWLRQDRVSEDGTWSWGLNRSDYVVIEFNIDHTYKHWFCQDRRGFLQRLDNPDVVGDWIIEDDQITIFATHGFTAYGDEILQIDSIDENDMTLSSITDQGKKIATINYIQLKI